MKDTATPVTIDNDASIRQITNVKNSKPGILGYIKDKLNEITSVHGPDTQTVALEPWVRGQLLLRAGGNQSTLRKPPVCLKSQTNWGKGMILYLLYYGIVHFVSLC